MGIGSIRAIRIWAIYCQHLKSIHLILISFAATNIFTYINFFCDRNYFNLVDKSKYLRWKAWKLAQASLQTRVKILTVKQQILTLASSLRMTRTRKYNNNKNSILTGLSINKFLKSLIKKVQAKSQFIKYMTSSINSTLHQLKFRAVRIYVCILRSKQDQIQELIKHHKVLVTIKVADITS